MKGVVLGFKRRNGRVLRIPAVKKPNISFKEFLQKYGILCLFSILFFAGLFLGASAEKSADEAVLTRLDFLFITNIESRLDMSAFEVFASCFSSDFLFIFAVFLFGLSAWGCTATPLLILFKGFSVGISSAALFSLYRFSGMGFYLLVILPGTVLFLLALTAFSRTSFSVSLRYLRLSLDFSNQISLKAVLKNYLFKSAGALLFTAASALLDMMTWVLFSGLFEF